jgi:hypothetical protein
MWACKITEQHSEVHAPWSVVLTSRCTVKVKVKFTLEQTKEFYVFLTVHHSIDLFNYQLNAQFLYSIIYVLH